VIVNAGPPATREEVEPVGKEFLERNFADGNQGELYRIDLELWFFDNGQSLHEEANWEYRDSPDPQWYRHAWAKRTREIEDDYSALIRCFQALARTNTSPGELDVLLDTEAMLKLIAVRGYIGDWDTFTMIMGRNGYMYRRPHDGRFQFLHWDSDQGYITEQPFYGKLIKTWMEQSNHRQSLADYLSQLNRICVGEPERFHTWLASERAATDGSVIQAAYTNYFKIRAAEAEGFIQEHAPDGLQTAAADQKQQ